MNENYKQYLSSEKWKIKKQEIYKKRGNRCECCGKIGGCTDIHHTTYENIFDEKEEDLLIMCSYCHKRIHEIQKILKCTLKDATVLIINKNKQSFEKNSKAIQESKNIFLRNGGKISRRSIKKTTGMLSSNYDL